MSKWINCNSENSNSFYMRGTQCLAQNQQYRYIVWFNNNYLPVKMLIEEHNENIL
jgi:hypothetical protein